MMINTGKTIRKHAVKYCCSIVLIISMIMTLLLGTSVFASDSYEVISENLLVNPDWEEGLDGWEILADSQKESFGDHESLCSIVYQDVPVEDYMRGKSVKLSGEIGTAPEDPTQESLYLAMIMCGEDGYVVDSIADDGSFMYDDYVSEESTQKAYHEVIMDVPSEADHIRVSMEIRKQGDKNNFNFDDLCLEVIEKSALNGNAFVKSAGSESDSAEQTSELDSSDADQEEPDAQPDIGSTALVIDEGDGLYTVPNLYIPEDAIYYNGHYYYYYDEPELSWTGAYSYCFSANGHLVTITSEDEQAFLEAEFPGTQGWIGAYLDEGVWKWCVEEPFEYTNWKEGEPNNLNGEEGYAHLYTGMQWNDVAEDDTSFHSGFYCEWDPDSDTITYYSNGRYNGEINDESRRLSEEGKTYYYGTDSVACDYEKAFQCFRDALNEDDNAEAWYYCARILAEDLVETSFQYYRAFWAYDRAIDFGEPLGWLGIGMMFLCGQLFKRDYDKAMKCFQICLELGCDEANYGFGRLYSEGKSMEPDYDKALEYYEKAAASAEKDWRNAARWEAGWLYAKGYITGEPDYTKAYEWWISGAQEDDGDCSYGIGWMYSYGYGVEEDGATALYWFDRAAWYGDPFSYYCLGMIYSGQYSGYGVEQNDELAFQYFKKSANLGDVDGMEETADCYYYGIGTSKDYTAALEWYQKAAELGSTYGMYSLGYMYEYGEGASVDLPKARQWYERILENQDTAEAWVVDDAQEGIERIDSGESVPQDNNNASSQNQNEGYDTSADYDNNSYYEYQTQPWEDPYFIGYTQDGVPQYSYETYQYETQPWENPYFIGYTQDGVPQYSFN